MTVTIEDECMVSTHLIQTFLVCFFLKIGALCSSAVLVFYSITKKAHQFSLTSGAGRAPKVFDMERPTKGN